MANFPLSNLLDGTKKIWSVMTGAAADDAAASGNPMLVAGKYSATPATRHDGDVVTQQMTADGAALVQLSGSNIEQAKGENIATKSALVAGESPTGTQVPVSVDSEGQLQVGQPKRLKVIASVIGYEVLPSTQGIAFSLVEFDCPIFMVAIRANSAHAYRVVIIDWYINKDTNKKVGVDTIIDTSTTGATSGWIEALTDSCRIRINNDDTVNSHTYDVCVYGIF